MKTIENLLYIGYDGYEYFFNESDKNDGWSLIGLRANTEEELRKRQREIDPEDLGISLEGWGEKWFDFNKFADDMEEDWQESFDVQSEIEVNGETVYLGFGSGTNIKRYFESNGIKVYDDYTNHFVETGLTKDQFNELVESDFEVETLQKLYKETYNNESITDINLV